MRVERVQSAGSGCAQLRRANPWARANSHSLTGTLYYFYKDCGLGSVKNLSDN